jgi:hypothetical protein
MTRIQTGNFSARLCDIKDLKRLDAGDAAYWLGSSHTGGCEDHDTNKTKRSSQD